MSPRFMSSSAIRSRMVPPLPRASTLAAILTAAMTSATAAGVALCAGTRPAAAQDLILEGPIYDGPMVYERPPAYLPPGRGGLRYVMLPPVEVRRRLAAMGYWQISQPHLAGRTYVVNASDEEGPLRLRLDAYSGEVLRVEPLPGRSVGAPPPGARPPAPSTARTQPAAPLRGPVPLPPPRPPEADVATAAPDVLPSPAQMPARIPAEAPAGALPPEAPTSPAPEPAAPGTSAALPSAAPAATAVVPPAADGHGASEGAAPVAAPVPAPTQPQAQLQTQAAAPPAPTASAAPVPEAPAGTGAGTATPGSTDAGSASVLSRPAGTP